MQIRAALLADLPEIQAIYAHHVLHGTGTFEDMPPSVEEMTSRYEEVAARGWAWLVAADASGVLGYAYYAMFGDGAAAIVLRAGDGGETLVEAAGEHLWPDTLDVMGWNIDPLGFGVILRRTIPEFVTTELKPALTQVLGRMQLSLGDIDKFICHPGGAKVIDAIETALSLHQGTLEHERAVIADYGNMSSPTALFVLERNLAKGLPRRSLLAALGPGFTASCVSLRRAA